MVVSGSVTNTIANSLKRATKNTPLSMMTYQRSSIPHPPSSTGAIKNNNDAGLTSPHSANAAAFKSKISDLSNNNGRTHNGAQRTVAYGSSGRLQQDVRNRRGGGGGFQDPAYAQPPYYASAKSSNSTSATNATNSSQPKINTATNSRVSISIPVAVLLWYILGVISIASSKVLLSTHNVPPLILTMQQLIIGMTLLRIQIEMQTSGDYEKDRLLCRGLQPIPMQHQHNQRETGGPSERNCIESGTLKRKSTNIHSDAMQQNSSCGAISAILALAKPTNDKNHIHNQLLLAGIYFALGFLLTNFGFQSGSAAFVETVKAAEPFTSASVAVLWGIEILGKEEVASLTGIVGGVVLSTLGHRAKPAAADGGGTGELVIPSQSLKTKCIIVMLSNLCFSFRGLHQKLFRSTPQGSSVLIDDLNLQFRMQQIGVLMLIVPTLLGYSVHGLANMQGFSINGSSTKYALEYVLLSLVNGLAFTSYNLASTFVLTRISVVHHAALNCIRRVFAIIVTSIIFGLNVTFLQMFGIVTAVGGFFSYIHFKMKKETKDKRRKELRKKWGVSGKWTGKSSSLLPASNVMD